MGIFDWLFGKNNRTRRWNYDNGVRKEEYQVNKNGVKHGIYKLYHPNQQLIVEVNFTKGVQDDGKIISYHDNGKIAREVMFLNGKFNGEFLECYNNGKRKKQGFYVDNKQTILKEWSENGELKEEAPKENKAENLKLIENDNGLNEIYFENGRGNIKERFTKLKGKKHGLESFYYEDGTLEKEENWKNGKEDGLTRWFDKSGQLEEESNWKDGKKNGFTKIYYKSGQLKEEANFKNDKINGLAKKYYVSGQLEQEANFKNGKKLVEKEMSYKNDIEEERKLNPDLPPFYLSQKIIDESNNKETQPTAPTLENEEVKDKVKYKLKKNASEFENIKEIIDFLSSEKDIIIKANAYEYWDGYFQLNDDPKSDNIKHSSLYNESGDEIISVNEVNGKQEISGDYADGYDIKKQTYEDGYCIWANCQVEMDFLMDELNKYLSEDDDNAQNEIEYFYDYLELPQDSDEAIEFFDNGTDGDNGIGREEGIDEFSWEATSYIRDAGVELVFIKL